ncbi:MAG: DUF434 domain-containing protein [Desulfurococcaceae archaeon]|nr:DUF434 domain-containing protein [Desulfurococcaceae archaeon]
MFSGLVRLEVVEASRDYRYLLDRGYRQKVVLDLITSRYGLSSVERSLLLRCVHSSRDAGLIKGKIVGFVAGHHLIVDGYNVLLTIHSVLEGMNVFLCDDGFVRDLRKSYRKGVELRLLAEAAGLLTSELRYLSPGKVTVVLDKNVSYSATHANTLRDLLGASTDVILADRADVKVLGGEGVVASSDYVVITRAKKVYDLAGEIIKKHFKEKIIDLASMINTQPSKHL